MNTENVNEIKEYIVKTYPESCLAYNYADSYSEEQLIEECENYYGKSITIEKDDLSKPHEDSFWAVSAYNYGEYVHISPPSIKKESLNKDLQKLTWLDEPVEI